MVLQAGTGVSEQLFKNRAHGEHRRATIDHTIIDLARMHFPSGGSGTLQ